MCLTFSCADFFSLSFLSVSGCSFHQIKEDQFEFLVRAKNYLLFCCYNDHFHFDGPTSLHLVMLESLARYPMASFFSLSQYV